jgi:hypothetical protein
VEKPVGAFRMSYDSVFPHYARNEKRASGKRYAGSTRCWRSWLNSMIRVSFIEEVSRPCMSRRREREQFCWRADTAPHEDE